MTPDQHNEAAARLLTAEETGQQCGLLSLAYPGMTLEDAYAVQKALVAQKLAKGRKKIGWKIGLTSRAMQQALNIATPDSGVLLDDMAFETGSTVPAGRFIQPRVEAEIAFVMKAPLAGADCTHEDVIAATDYVAPSLEILDTRILRADPATGQARIITDTISDNAANAGVVLGEARHDIDAHDLRWVGAIATRNGTVEETGLGAGVLNDPVTSVLWLARRMAEYGQQIDAGDIVLSGSFIRPIECPPGSEITADFGPFGHVAISFA
ncbi:2-oxo-hept-4-ene-1,7-dioate hydratase [Phaeobacter gallaeciensis]|uniref:2-oxo-hept-4-ene-1,7-dioate hydratase n=1 Tax=Phaeobacter gallaeciensis TaxID=60890 RepID=UPI00237F75FD|nr:2-oxo-hepta-3-ene-1,7-dioic acid hydratase [Phaeobacter gallaeciensis]MDE4098481.1 2-oxo-hepta-3-ene-1,7-dioic acid hydratase [Phaeobacter gallaeciensis]MDE4107291.1 2-oxo-hepta-3-ene-1,7-dioic acid hydratase [Phaeobacter gallaeciensis]MDE4111757.1 2-oxo-hepta-3-ene-1,7-dioic acid hydratase [Phaeobacter gallaeciensis]MDE4116216.1 2-oxo-hepta-3-ene-1,7-dioic acid hydratase [Phaeobacter gallaeciensis]MDE4120687.1 2-oxo-hepta-3-ene-1,7-dioic acid hydratase [Phaeobacter gallaeciensis]